MQIFAFTDFSFAQKRYMSNWMHLMASQKLSRREEGPESDKKVSEFQAFAGIPIEQCKVIELYCMLRRRDGGVSCDEVFSHLSDKLTHQQITEAMEQLLMDGWIQYDMEGPFGHRDGFRLTHDVEVALKSNNPNLLPESGRALKENPKLRLYARAMTFRSRQLDIEAWISFCADSASLITPYVQRKPIVKLQPIELGILGFLSSIYDLEERGCELNHLVDLFSRNQHESIKIRKLLATDQSALFTKGFLVRDRSYRNSMMIRPADRMLYNGKQKPGERESTIALPAALSSINCKSIKPCRLLYNDNLLRQVDDLRGLLSPRKFGEYCKSMKSQGRVEGVAIMLSGPPGSGKTELARQLARTTGRDLFLFDVSQQRDMYLGESEKRIREVFQAYSRCIQEMKPMPILFFNEADSVFHQRTDRPSGTSNTDNAVQTILLNELEVFKGILIATTNRPNSMDDAFDRRFLLHLKIEYPNEKVRTALLQHHFPTIPYADVERLARNYQFSPAQLELFDRQQEIKRMLHGDETNILFALEQFLQGNGATIGGRRLNAGFKYAQ